MDFLNEKERGLGFDKGDVILEVGGAAVNDERDLVTQWNLKKRSGSDVKYITFKVARVIPEGKAMERE